MSMFRLRSASAAIKAALLLASLLAVGYLAVWKWMICRIEVPPGSSLLVRYKGPWPFGASTQAPEGTLVHAAARRTRPGWHSRRDAWPGPPFLLAARI